MQIEWRDDNHVIMTGPTEFEFDGLLDATTGETKIEIEV
jgi:diaminopimelate epimerase